MPDKYPHVNTLTVSVVRQEISHAATSGTQNLTPLNERGPSSASVELTRDGSFVRYDDGSRFHDESRSMQGAKVVNVEHSKPTWDADSHIDRDTERQTHPPSDVQHQIPTGPRSMINKPRDSTDNGQGSFSVEVDPSAGGYQRPYQDGPREQGWRRQNGSTYPPPPPSHARWEPGTRHAEYSSEQRSRFSDRYSALDHSLNDRTPQPFRHMPTDSSSMQQVRLLLVSTVMRSCLRLDSRLRASRLRHNLLDSEILFINSPS